MRRSLLTFAFSLGCALSLQASTIQIFYTENATNDVQASFYNTATNLVGPSTTIGNNTSGADGIVIGPAGTVIYGGEITSNTVFQIRQNGVTGGGYPATASTAGLLNSYLVAINQNSPTNVFAFDNSGDIAKVPIVSNVIQTGTLLPALSGSDSNVTDLFWSNTNTAYYLSGTTGQNGDLGTINLVTGATARLSGGTNLATAQSSAFDPSSGLVLLFGQGQVALFNPSTNTVGTAVTLPGATAGAECNGAGSTPNQLDLGTVDGSGDGFVAGCGDLMYFTYTASGVNSTTLTLTFTNYVAVNGIKDVAVLTSATPEPSSVAGILAALGGVLVWRRRRG